MWRDVERVVQCMLTWRCQSALMTSGDRVPTVQQASRGDTLTRMMRVPSALVTGSYPTSTIHQDRVSPAHSQCWCASSRGGSHVCLRFCSRQDWREVPDYRHLGVRCLLGRDETPRPDGRRARDRVECPERLPADQVVGQGVLVDVGSAELSLPAPAVHPSASGPLVGAAPRTEWVETVWLGRDASQSSTRADSGDRVRLFVSREAP